MYFSFEKENVSCWFRDSTRMSREQTRDLITRKYYTLSIRVSSQVVLKVYIQHRIDTITYR